MAIVDDTLPEQLAHLAEVITANPTEVRRFLETLVLPWSPWGSGFERLDGTGRQVARVDPTCAGYAVTEEVFVGWRVQVFNSIHPSMAPVTASGIAPNIDTAREFCDLAFQAIQFDLAENVSGSVWARLTML